MLFYERRQTNDRFDQEYFMDNIIPSSSTSISNVDILSAATLKQVASCSKDVVAANEAAAIMLNAEKAAAQIAAKVDENSKSNNNSSETDSKSENSNLADNKCDITIKSKENENDSNTITQLSSDDNTVAVFPAAAAAATTTKKTTVIVPRTSLLSKELEEWIWQDNRHFLQDRNIFEHTYFK